MTPRSIQLAVTVLALSLGAARADECTPPSSGPDVMLGELMQPFAGEPGLLKYGPVGEITAYSMSVDACNIGDTTVSWDDAAHPGTTQNLYRLSAGRFEHIGMGWVKHGFAAGSGSTCCVCTSSPDPGLDPACSSIYTADLNATQCTKFGRLGPRSEVDAFTGQVGSFDTHCGSSIFKRLQVHTADLDPSLHPAARYFGEANSVAADDAAAGNADNNASYREIIVTGFSNGGWDLSPVGATQRRIPAIEAWHDIDPTVDIQDVEVPGEGRFILEAIPKPL